MRLQVCATNRHRNRHLHPKQRSPLTIYEILLHFKGEPSVGAVVSRYS